jgi:hypothetical protein
MAAAWGNISGTLTATVGGCRHQCGAVGASYGLPSSAQARSDSLLLKSATVCSGSKAPVRSAAGNGCNPV